MFHRFVNVVQVLAVIAAAVTVIFLLAGGSGDDADGDGAAAGGGAAVYAANCAGCHGVDGGGLSGPAIAGGVLVERYPDVGAQIAVITGGRGAMPAFGDTLTTEEIGQVTTYTREEL